GYDAEDLHRAQCIPRGATDDRHRWRPRAGGDRRSGLPKQRAQYPLDLTDARLTRVVRYNKAQHNIIDRDFVHAQTIPFDLPGPQVAASDGNLLVSRIAIESNHFHTIQEWSWNGFGHVRCCNEQNMREVEFDIQVMILERMILRRIEHFEKRRRGITAPI